MNIFSFYITTNNVNGKIYYGVHREREWPDTDKYLGSGKVLAQAIVKYGKENFTRKILCVASSEEYVLELERKMVTSEFIREDTNYNVQGGGYGSSVCSDATKKKIGLKAKGRKHTNASKKKMSEARKGRVSNRRGSRWTEEEREKHNAAREAYWNSEAGRERRAEMSQKSKGENNQFHGKKHSEENKQKIREYRRGKKASPKTIAKMLATRKGYKHSEETRQKISQSMMGNSNRKALP